MPPRERSRRRRGPRGGDPNRPSQQSRRERGLPTEDREHERSARRRDPWVERGRDREREYARESRERRPAREDPPRREVYRAQSPRQPRFPPPGVVETWETRRPPRPVSESEGESLVEERSRDRRRRSQTPSEQTERSRSRPRGRWQKCWVWVPEGGLSPVRDDSRDREGSQDDEVPEEDVELEGESVDTVTGEPRETRRTAVGDIAPEVPGASPEVASGVDFSATEDSIARQATEEATEHSVSAEPETLRERARELRSKAPRPSASKPSPSVSEEQFEEKPPVEERVKPPPTATSAKAKVRKESSETGDIVREQSAVGALKRAIGRDTPSRHREGESSSGSGLKRALEELPVPPPVPTKEEIEQTEAARKREIENLPTPPPAPRTPPVQLTRASSKPRLTEEVRPVVLAPRPKERPAQPEQTAPSPSSRPPEPRGAPTNWQDKPLVLLDFHKTLSFPNNDPPVAEATVQTLKTVKEKGFSIGILSFASNKATQEGVAAGVAELERRLGWSFDIFARTRTKFSTDTEQGASITGHVGSKAKLVAQFGPIVYVDDQGSLLNDVRSLQQNVPIGHKTHCIRAALYPSEALVPLERTLRTFPRTSELPTARELGRIFGTR